jgi:hypothetical protein
MADFLELLGYFIALAIGIIGTYYAIIAYKRQKPVFVKGNYNVITLGEKTIPLLNVTYNTIPITNLSLTTVTFWNDGNQRIDKNDIPKLKPLMIQAKEGIRIFDSEIIARTKIENEFQAKINSNNNAIECRFDYLSKNDGVKIGVLHSGDSSDDITLIGTIKDVGAPVDITNSIQKRVWRILLAGLAVFSFVLGFLTSIIQPKILTAFQIEKGSGFADLILVAMMVLSPIIMYLITVVIRARFDIFNIGIPEQLR